ncbi:hypothetical protein VP01_1191g8 [Puccinia sorghi]|uniref:Uncharacterized protein n=1 Tax=Puccinia sorghi TaxID=27349 RepID=A0A0L6VQV4_9BASI|nr:hypothetical protein VP01_1191g8 [Puccinia sorghi]
MGSCWECSHWSAKITSRNLKFSDVRLQINCYTSNYIAALTETQRHLLNPNPPVDLDKLLTMTQKLCD